MPRWLPPLIRARLGLALGLCLGLGTVMSLTAGAAADPLPRARVAFRQYGVAEGLLNQGIWCILQDRQGFVWLGSEGGVFRYDGHRFTAFGSAHGLASGEVFALHQDPAGTLWAGTFDGLFRWDGSRFQPTGVARVLVESIRTGPEGRIWISTPSGPHQQDSKGAFSLVPGWPGGEATAMWMSASASDPVVWVASTQTVAHRSLTQVHRWQGGVWSTMGAGEAFQGQRLDALAMDPKGRLWARSAHALWVLQPHSQNFQAAALSVSLTHTRGSLSLDRGGRLWLPTSRDLMVLEGDTWHRVDPLEGYPTRNVRAVLEDRENNLWIVGSGVSRRLGRGALTYYSQREGLPSDLIWSIYRDGRGTLWVGTDRGACRNRNGRWVPEKGLEGLVVRSITEDRQGRLYFAGGGQAVYRLDPDGALARFPLDPGRPTKRIFRIAVDALQRLWIGTENSGLLMADCRGTAFQPKPVVLPGGDPSERISDVASGGDGRLWISGSRGLALLEKGTWRRYTSEEGLRKTQVAYARPARNGELLVSYFDAWGMSRFRVGAHRLEEVRHLSQASGLAADKVYIMGEDSLDTLWVGTGAGLDRLRQDRLEHFGSMDGLPSDDCAAMAILSEPDGTLWIGTSGGLVHIQAGETLSAPAPPNSVITHASAEGLDLPLTPDTAPVIPFGQNTLEFSFAGLSFASESQLERQVRLVGLEDAWHTTASREARYPALPRGIYRFEARCRLANGPWGPVASYGFVILPPWWQRAWFLAFSLLGLAGGVMGLIRWRVAALQRHAQELETLVASRTQELKVANDALRSQSLTDPLTGLHNRRYLGTSLPADIAQVNRSHHGLRLGQTERLTANIDLLFLMVDIDHFKEVNDQYGHHAGDLVLQQVAVILGQATRESDTVVRWGGEEFLVVARNTCRKDSRTMAERVRSMIEAHRFNLGNGRTMHRTCSVGYAVYPLAFSAPELFAWEQVVDLADQCLYAAKRGGRNAYVGVSATEDGVLMEIERHGALSMEKLVEAGALAVDVSPSLHTPLAWKG